MEITRPKRVTLQAWFADGTITVEFEGADQWHARQVLRVFSEDETLKMRRGEYHNVGPQLSHFNRMVDSMTSILVTLGYTTGDGTLVVEVLT